MTDINEDTTLDSITNWLDERGIDYTIDSGDIRIPKLDGEAIAPKMSGFQFVAVTGDVVD